MKFMNLKKKIAPALMGGALAVATAVPAFAAEAGTGLSSVETALTTSFTSVGSSMTSLVGKILPIALRSWELFSLLDLVSKHLRKLQIKPDGFQNGLLTWCKVREGDTFLTFFMQMYLINNVARAGS